MADPYDELIAGLLSESTNKAIAAENPYVSFMGLPSAGAKAVATAASQNLNAKNLRQTAYASILGGLLEGVLGSAGQNYQEDLTSKYFKAASTGQAVEGLPGTLSERASRMYDIFQKQKANALIEDEVQRRLDIRDALKTKVGEGQINFLDKLREIETLGETKLQRDRATAAIDKLTKKKGEEPTAGMSGTGDETYKKYAERANLYGEDVAGTMAKEENKDWLERVDVNTKRQILQADSVTDGLRALADEIESLGLNAAELNASKQLASSAGSQLTSKAKLMVAPVVRLSGDVGNIADKEQARAIEAILGDRTAGTQTIAEKLRGAADLYGKMILGKAIMAKKGVEMGGDAIIAELQKKLDIAELQKKLEGAGTTTIPAIGETFRGSEVISVKEIK